MNRIFRIIWSQTLSTCRSTDLNEAASLFGVLSYGKSLVGSDSERRLANVGMRIPW